MKGNGLISKITAPMVRGASKVKFKVVKYSPEICMVVGFATGIATIVTACKATLKSGDILDDLANAKAEIEEKEQAAAEAGESFNKGLEMTKAYKDVAVGFTRLYGPTAALGAISAASFLGAYGIIKGRNTRLLGVSAASIQGLKEYRQRVVDKYGEEADRELASGVVNKDVLIKEVNPETGEVDTDKKNVPTMDQVMMEDPSNYDRIFARGLAKACQSYDPNTNEAFLQGQQTFFTYLLQTKGYVFLSEVYESLGFPVTPESRLVGWILDYADPNYRDKKVSFGNLMKVYNRDGDFIFPTGRVEQSYIDSGYYLTFNVDGLIWNLI